MKKTAIVGVFAAAMGLVVGSQLPKSGTAGYTVHHQSLLLPVQLYSNQITNPTINKGIKLSNNK